MKGFVAEYEKFLEEEKNKPAEAEVEAEEGKQ